MKTRTKAMLSALVLGASVWMLTAQDGGRPNRDHQPPPHPDGPPGPGMHGHHPPPPVIGALDANHDGIIDAQEIANASQALLTLDEDGDGKLTREELRPPPPDDMGPPPPPFDDDDLPPPPFPPPGW